MASPTQHTLKVLREWGYLAQVVEWWNPHCRRRVDLFGFVDVLAVGGSTLAVQCTSASGVSARRKKIQEDCSETAGRLMDAGWWIQVWGWGKRSNGRWRGSRWVLTRSMEWERGSDIDTRGREAP